MKNYSQLKDHSRELENKLGYRFKDKDLIALAFTHRSFVNESKEVSKHNERLEFLGDSVLGVIISSYLYRYLPNTPEGELSDLRSRLVEASACVSYIQKLEVEPFLLLGKGERQNGARGRDSILSDLFEAIVGAIYLDSDIDQAQKFIFKNFSSEINQILKTPLKNWKAILQDHTQKNYQQTPSYKVLATEGPDHSKIFTVAVEVDEREIGEGSGSSKKEAQQLAAKEALKHFGVIN